MDANEVRSKVKDIISNVTNIDPDEIADNSRFIEDLELDSLSLMEIGVDVDYEFKLGVPEEQLQELRTVGETVALVLRHRESKVA